jgi:membrane associated rhomboid family serine protease
MSSPFGGGGYGRPQIRIGGPLTPTVKMLLLVNGLIFVLIAIPSLTDQGENALNFLLLYLGMTPTIFWSQFTLWMPFTYMFVHVSFMHILFNMFALWMFGGDVEKVFGTRRFLIFYFICGIGAGLFVGVVNPGLPIPTIGASGAIYAIILAYGLFFPDRTIYLYFILPVKVKYFVLVMGALVFLSAMASSNDGISHYAHLGGLVIGFLYIRWRGISKYVKRLFTKRRTDAEVIKFEQIRKMFDEAEDDDDRIH